MALLKRLSFPGLMFMFGSSTSAIVMATHYLYSKPHRYHNGFTKEEQKVNDDGFIEGERCGTQRLRQSLEGVIFKHYHLNSGRDPTHDELKDIIWNTRTDDYFA